MTASFKPRTLGHSSYNQMGIVPGSFITAGAGVDPTVFDGAITNVEQLDTAGATSFFRITLDEKYRNGTYSSEASAELLAEADDLTVTLGELVADAPAPARTDFQVDLLIRDGGTADVTTGRKVSLHLFIKR